MKNQILDINAPFSMLFARERLLVIKIGTVMRECLWRGVHNLLKGGVPGRDCFEVPNINNYLMATNRSKPDIQNT